MAAAAGEDPKLIIVDDFVEKAAKDYGERGDALDKAMKQYLSILDKISSEAIPSGAQHDALVAFASTAKTLYGGKSARLKTISDNLNSKCKNFISQVDQDDSFLY
ncbi:hypothetical protein PT279_00355 [Bifidobacterium sp. ESL0784]|uniref:hypothetical protein n=1 Tax=Bifidobacterium sp. ESL0784 TaxID=2983231 RepID=UPI0023F61B5A|nr:hypothetical protein [Bifidobacterium sp. ESL0784]MDF7640057.1 hypothetical protein [Bifidobacterium sp. ESL0784]